MTTLNKQAQDELSQYTSQDLVYALMTRDFNRPNKGFVHTNINDNDNKFIGSLAVREIVVEQWGEQTDGWVE